MPDIQEKPERSPGQPEINPGSPHKTNPDSNPGPAFDPMPPAETPSSPQTPPTA